MIGLLLPEAERQSLKGLRLWAEDAIERCALRQDSRLGFAGVWNDQSEELPEDIGTEIRALLRQPGYPHQLIFSPNPPDEEHFLADQFPDDQDLPGRKLYRLSLYDNQHNLPADTIEKMEEAYRPRTRNTNRSFSDCAGRTSPAFRSTKVPSGARTMSSRSRLTPRSPCSRRSCRPTSSRVAGRATLPFRRNQSPRRHHRQAAVPRGFHSHRHSYRYEFFDQGPKRPVLCCDPPPNRDDMNRYTSVDLLRAAGLTPRYRENANSPDVRESVVQTIGGMMKRRMGSTYGFAVSDDENRWLMIWNRHQAQWIVRRWARGFLCVGSADGVGRQQASAPAESRPVARGAAAVPREHGAELLRGTALHRRTRGSARRRRVAAPQRRVPASGGRGRRHGWSRPGIRVCYTPAEGRESVRHRTDAPRNSAAMGENGIAALAEVQANIPVLTASLDTAHQRLDVMADQQKLVDASVQHCVQGLSNLRMALDAHSTPYRIPSVWVVSHPWKPSTPRSALGSRLRWLLTGR